MTWHYNDQKSLLENWMDLISIGKVFETDPGGYLKGMEAVYAKQITVQELYPRYLEAEEARGKITKSGIKERQYFFDRMLLPFLRDYAAKHPYFRMEAAHIDKKMLQAFADFLVDTAEIERVTGIKIEKYSHATIVKYFNYLNSFRNYAVKKDILPYCLSKKDIDFPAKREVKNIDAFTADELKAFFNRLDNDPLVSLSWKGQYSSVSPLISFSTLSIICSRSIIFSPTT